MFFSLFNVEYRLSREFYQIEIFYVCASSHGEILGHKRDQEGQVGHKPQITIIGTKVRSKMYCRISTVDKVYSDYEER